ncbi:hypothetical protein Q9L58_010645 [Maublancomyces gigas]|uniref:Uncharacterized protein n=1 Tax=Discina gigas TaxID=1032678 RepID=A0ABR3G3I5_9PEZI
MTTTSPVTAASSFPTTIEVLPAASSFPEFASPPPSKSTTLFSWPPWSSSAKQPPLVVDLLSDSPDAIGPTRRRKKWPTRPDVHIISREPAHDEDKDAVATAFIQREAEELEEIEVETEAAAEVETEADAETDAGDDKNDEQSRKG